MSFKVKYPGAKEEPIEFFTRGWRGSGKPIIVVNHFTVGCGDPLGAFRTRRVSAHFCVMQDAKVIQYVDLTDQAWHADNINGIAVGIEHAAAPGLGCTLTDDQLKASADLNGWLCDHFGIPKVRSPGWRHTPGIKVHADGLEPGSDWNLKRHYDAIWQADGDVISAWLSKPERKTLNRSKKAAGEFISEVDDMGVGNDYFEQLQNDGISAGEFSAVVRFVWGFQRGYRSSANSHAQDDVAQAGFEAGEAAKAQEAAPKH